MDDAASIHQRFSQLPGSEHIATEHAIRGCIHLLRKGKPKSVLEVGAGIGTLTFALVKTLSEVHGWDPNDPPFAMFSTENNGFCLGELNKNLNEYHGRFQVIPDISCLPSSVPQFDFVIIDGGDLDERYFSRLAPRARVFVESYRFKQQLILQSKCLDRKWIYANFRSLDRKNGFWLYQFEPLVTERAKFALVKWYNRAVSFFRRRLTPKAA